MSDTDQRFSNKKLLSFKTMIQELPEVAYIFDDEGRLLFWNRNVEKILGYTHDELLNKNILEFIDQADRPKVLEVFNDVLEGKKRTAEYQLLTKTGDKLHYIGSGTMTEISGKQYVIGQAIHLKNKKSVETFLDTSDDLGTLIDIERKHIIRTLNKTNWRISGLRGAARILDIHPETLRSRMRKLGIKRPEK